MSEKTEFKSSFSSSDQSFNTNFGDVVETQGPPGLSAYEVAVKEGFVGTVEEWLESLQGEDGEPGPPGKSAYAYALEGGFTGSEKAFMTLLANGGGGSGTGGGGTAAPSVVLTLTNTSEWISKTISNVEDCMFTFSWSSIEDEAPTGGGSMNIKINGISKMVKNIQQGDVEVNLKDMLGTGENSVMITVTDVYGKSKTLALTIEVVAFSLASSFDDSIVYSGDVSFPYTPRGSVTKTMHFILDGNEIGTEDVTTSGRQQNYTIPAQSHKAHSLEVYFTAELSGKTVESNRLYYDIMFKEEGNNDPIIASSFNEKNLQQFYTVSIPHYVHTPDALTTDVEYYVNGTKVAGYPVDRTRQVWRYRPDTTGAVKLEIVAGSVRKTFNVTVAATEMDVAAETNNLELHLSSYGRNNAEENRDQWKYGSIETEFNGFNWVSDGWQKDEEENTVLRIAGGASIEIPLNIFRNDFRGTGKTIEFEFATSNVMNYEAEIISCFSGGRGLVITAQQAALYSEQSEVFKQYKENEHVRVSFVVDKRIESRLINLYIDGILSGTVQYPDDDDFQQGSPVGITIGSADCTLDLYCIRVYNNNLTRYQILDNWIADMQDGGKMMETYLRNNIYDDYGQVVISKLPVDLPYLVLEASSLPQYKGDKKTASGYYTDPNIPGNSFRFTDAEIDVQGTSSQYYKRKNYKIKFKNGFEMVVSGETLDTYKMREDSIGVNTFTFKADVASSEGANNVELVKLWNDICPYKTPPQLDDSSVRQGIDGFPIVTFWYDGKETRFLGKYNFNNDKATEEVFGFDDGDESWEIRNNTSDRSMFKSADFSGTAWLEDFEGRYPDGNTDPTNLAQLAAWLVSTDQAQATGNALNPAVTYEGVTYTHDTAAYRLAKFKDEAEDWLEMDSIIFSYIFTELFLMVDSRAKNNFPTFYDNGKWCVLPYDMDTAIGTNNEGLLVFDYNLEDTDQVNGANVYNGQDSVLYINTRDAFSDRIEEMYGELRSGDILSYDVVDKRFEDHQALWPESIFNEDAYFKYIEPLTEDGEATYLSMCQGSKKSQRKWWLFNRFRYIDSKYTTGDALTSTITLRAYQKSNFAIIPYADVYPCVAFDSTRVKERGRRGEVCNIISPVTWDPNGSDAVVTVYSADQLKDIGDISAFKVGYADFSKATRLQRIKVGDASTAYRNENMTELYVGNNKLLQVVDARNCVNLTANVNLSGCSGIEEVYFDGTAIAGVMLPNGGNLKTLHLPRTVKNLTLRNQKSLTDFVFSPLSKLETLWLENMGNVVNSITILKTCTMPNARVRLVGVDWTVNTGNALLNIYNELSGMRGLDEQGNNTDSAVVTGKCHIGIVSNDEPAMLESLFPYLDITYDTMTTKANLIFMNHDGTEELYRQALYGGENGTAPNIIPMRPADERYTYNFAGWSETPGGEISTDYMLNVTEDKTLYAVYTETLKSYTVGFYNGDTLLESKSWTYGSIPTYSGTTPTSENGYAFAGWTPDIAPVTGDAEYRAKFAPPLLSRMLIDRTITAVDNDKIISAKPYTFRGCYKLQFVNLPNVATISGSMFYSCEELQTADFAKATNIESNAFYRALKLSKLILRSEIMCTLGGSVSNVFNSTAIEYGTGYVYVPKALIEDYKAATNWSTIANQFRALEDYTVDGTITGALDESKI